MTDISVLHASLSTTPPEPTADQPFIQLDWIFESRWARVPSSAGKDNYKQALRIYKSFVARTKGVAPFYLATEWDEFCLIRFNNYVELATDSDGDVPSASHSRVGLLSAVRQVIFQASDYGLLKTASIQNIAIGSGYAETDGHSAYSEEEVIRILGAVEQEISRIQSSDRPYISQPVGIGEDPRQKPTKGRAKLGWGIEENLRWYFEQEMNAVPMHCIGKAKTEHARFFVNAIILGGLGFLYNKWGIDKPVGPGLVMPFAIKLSYLTGLNPTSSLGLKTDSYRPAHPLTGLPFLLFMKRRSGGEQELHLALLDSSDPLDREQLVLRGKQSIQVKKLIDEVVKRTNSFRPTVSDRTDVETSLFIFQSTSNNSAGEVQAIASSHASRWCRDMVERYNLTNDEGAPLEFNMVRFRSTKLTAMALEGRDLSEIQQVARHKSVRQTVKYINLRRLDEPARREVHNALERIHANRVESIGQSTPTTAPSRIIPIQPFKGIVADCKNVFDPPDHVKASIGYVEGQACNRMNMCLFCRNVVILKEHLPVLCVYRSQILSIDGTNLQDLPHAHIYDKTVAVIDQLLDPEHGEFSEKDIEEAIAIAETLDIVIDPIVYRGVMN